MRTILILILAVSFALPLAAQDDTGVVGRVSIPYLYGDAGMVALQAGEVLPVTWNDAPPGALVYLFWWRGYDVGMSLMGVDLNPTNGVVIRWKVPEHIGGMPIGVALFADGTRIISDNRISGLEYGSGTAPPEGICTAGSSGMDGTPVFADSTTDSAFLGQLQRYAPVQGRVEDAQGIVWLKIALSSEVVYQYYDDPLPESGWVYDSYVRLFGNCAFLGEQ